MKTIVLFALLASGCSVAANAGKPGPASTATPDSDGAEAAATAMITVPDIVWHSEADARAALSAAGHVGTVMVSDALCPPEIDGRSVELGVVCYQHPPAGKRQGSKSPIQIKVQTRAP
jgi:hypothetical protein